MNIDQLRARLDKAEHDERLTQAEREQIRIQIIGVLVPRPRTVGEAKRYLAELELALARVTSEIPL